MKSVRTQTDSIGRTSTGRMQVMPLKITVLAGGPSSERAVSLESGRAITEALGSLGHEVAMLDITPQDLSALDRPADVVFPALHGPFGEDGTVQRLMDERGIRYVGSGPEASALAMNKASTKRLCSRADIPTADWCLVTPANLTEVIRSWRHRKSVVKPVDQGSSIDCHIVEGPAELASAAESLLRKYGQCLLEKFVDGPELTVGILDGQPLPVIQVVPARNFYDYTAKYQDDHTQYIVNPPLPADLLERVQALSAEAFRALGCRHLARVDWRVEAATGKPYLLEVNTLPGFTSHSLLPKAAAAAGIDFPWLCQRLVELALTDTRAALNGQIARGR